MTSARGVAAAAVSSKESNEGNRMEEQKESERWQRMSIGGEHSQGAGEYVIVSNVWGFLPTFKLPSLSRGVHRIMGALVVIATGVLLIFATASANKQATTTATSSTPVHNVQRPTQLRALLADTSRRAQAMGKLQPLATTSAVVNDGGIGFLVFTADYSGAEVKDKIPTLGPNTQPTADPFDAKTRDKQLVVAPIAPKHTLLLNKFFTLQEHALLVTDAYSPQTTPLTHHDFDAWCWSITQTNAVGFFNSAWEAGASQQHKHMQLVPLDVIKDLRSDRSNALPVEDVLLTTMASQEVYDPFDSRHTFRLRQYNFQHAFVRLMSQSQWKSAVSGYKVQPSYARYLYTAYVDLMRETGILQLQQDASLGRMRQRRLEEASAAATEDLAPYNIVLTESWMLVVPRSQRLFQDAVDVNGLGFAGLLLARDAAARALIEKVGPIQVLAGVATPSQ